MYTQRRSADGSASIPQNYSGNAFRYPPIGEVPENVKPTHTEKESIEIAISPPETSVTPVSAGRLQLGGFSLGTEELLLLGLCCLLIFGEGDGGNPWLQSGILPYLLLLLFCG